MMLQTQYTFGVIVINLFNAFKLEAMGSLARSQINVNGADVMNMNLTLWFAVHLLRIERRNN